MKYLFITATLAACAAASVASAQTPPPAPAATSTRVAPSAERVDPNICAMYTGIYGACGEAERQRWWRENGSNRPGGRRTTAPGGVRPDGYPVVEFQGESYYDFSLLRYEAASSELTTFELLYEFGPAAYYKAIADTRRFCLDKGVRQRPVPGLDVDAQGRIHGGNRNSSWSISGRVDSGRTSQVIQQNGERRRYVNTENLCDTFEGENEEFRNLNRRTQ